MNRRTYLAPGAHVVGDVTLGENVGIWYNAVVRGDTGSIFIDDNSNVQDNSTLHTDEGHSIHIGKGVSIGHNAVVHGCTVGDNTVVGMGSILLSGAVVGRISTTTTVTTIGKRIFSSLETGLNCSILTSLSFLVVKSFIIGGWIIGTSDIYEYAATAIGPIYLV